MKNKSETISKLAAALAKAQEHIGAAPKDAQNPFFKSRYADLGSVMAVAKEPLNANGISVLQLVNADDGTGNFLETTLLHTSGEYISSSMRIVVSKPNDPQSLGSAITYARRYALQAMLFIPSVDDDAEWAERALRNRPEDKEEEARKAVMEGKDRLSEDQALGLAKKRAEAKGTTIEAELEIIRKEEEDIEDPPKEPDPKPKAPKAKKEPKQTSTPPEGTKEPEPDKKPATDQLAQSSTTPEDERLEKFKILSYKIKCVKHAKYMDKLISELALEDFLAIKKKWIEPNQEAFKDQPEKLAEANVILKAIEMLETK